jgi:lysozyme family protein
MTDLEILADIKRSEGWPQYTDHPADAGGATKGGITLATFRTWRRDFTLTGADLRQLTEEEADAIYQFLYLQPFAMVADSALRHYLIVGVDADGWIGPQTLAAVEKYAQHVLVMLIGARFTHIAQRARENVTQKVFVQGWRNRNERFLPD